MKNLINHVKLHSVDFFKSRLMLFAFITINIGLWLLTPQDFFASDQWSYAERAYNISNSFKFGDFIFDHRLGLLLPTALFFKIFGVSIHSANLLPLLSLIMIIIIVWLSIPNSYGKFLGMCLVTFLLSTESLDLFPDIICTSFMTLSNYFLINRHYALRRYAYLSTLFLFLAFLTKLSFYYVFPLWVYFIHSDIADGKIEQSKSFYFFAILFGLFLGILYLSFCYITWGDFFARFKITNAFGTKHLWSFESYLNVEFLKRLTIKPLIFLLSNFYFLPLILCFAIFEKKIAKDWALHTFSCIFFIWFGSVSFTSYQPMPLSFRMFVPIVPGLIIVVSNFIAIKILNNKHSRLIVFIIFILLLDIHAHRFRRNLKRKIKPHYERLGIELINEKLKNNHVDKFMMYCLDSRSHNFLKIYFGFNYPKNLEVKYFLDSTFVNEESQFDEKVLVYVNKERLKRLNKLYQHKNYYKEIEKLDFKPIYESGPILIYQLTNLEERNAFFSFKNSKN